MSNTKDREVYDISIKFYGLSDEQREEIRDYLFNTVTKNGVDFDYSSKTRIIPTPMSEV